MKIRTGPTNRETLPFMKARLTMLRLLILLCGIFAVTTAAFGQATGNAFQTNFTWVAAGANLDLGTSTNWSPVGVPRPSAQSGAAGASTDYGDIMAFDGQTAGPVFPTSNAGAQAGSSVGGTTAGLYVRLTANQTNPVTFHTTVSGSASSGLRFNSMVVDAGAGAFTLGKNSTTNCLDTVWGTSNPSGQGITNNSANPVTIMPDVRWRYGAGGAHTITFGGTGDFNITNDLANVNGAATLVAKDGSGTMYWTAGHNAFWGTITLVSTPMTISGGTLVLKSGALFPATTTINNNGVALVLDAPASSQAGGAQTISSAVNGTGNLQVNNGTLTLSGANTFSGNISLSGGSLVANRAENFGVNGPLGNGGLISFTGGTLVFSSVNQYDYSPRITNSASQSFRFDTAGQNVTFTNVLASTSGTLTKLGSGTLTLSGANTYDGATTVSAGKLVIQGSQGNGAITVSNSAALGVNQGGSQITPASLTVGTSSSATLEFNNVSSTSTAAISTGPVSVGGPITINVNSGSFLIGSSYPLLTFTGTAPGVSLGTLVGAGGNLTTNGSTIQLNITSLAFVWSGLNNNSWDITTANDWKVNGLAQVFANGGTALFDDTITTANTNVVLNSPVSPASVTVNNSTKPYSITSAGVNLITGAGGLTKNASSSLTLAGGVNTYTGPTTLNGGITSVGVLASGGSPSDIGQAGSAAANLVLNGGTLQYTGAGATIDRLFTLGTAGGTIDDAGAGSLVLNNSGAIALSGSGARTLTLTGTGTDELDASLADNGGATALTKSGAGTWVVKANNANSGAVTITGGTLQVGNGGATGSVGSGNVTVNPGASVLSYNRTGTVTSGTVSGLGSVTVASGVTVVLPNNNSYSGGTTIDGTSTLQVGVGGATGQLAANGNITVDGTLDFNTSGTFAYGGTGISGVGNVIVRGGGKITSLGANSYSGWTVIGPGSIFQPCQGNQGALASSTVTNNGTLLLIRQDNGVFTYGGPITGSGGVLVDANNFNAGDVTLTGNNDYTGGTVIGDNGLIVGDGATSGSITGNVTFANSTQVPNDNARTITFNRSDDITFSGNITTNFASPQSNQGVLVQSGTGTLTLTGTNTYGSGTVISNGVLQVGNGGTSGTIGTGPINDISVLSVNRAGTLAIGSVISGGGSVVKLGTGTLLLNGVNTFTGGTTVSNGVLGGTGTLASAVTLTSGTTLAPGASVGTLTVNGNLSIGGNLAIEVNKSLAPSNDLVVVSGVLTNAGTGTVTVTNLGPALTVGDKFTLFSQPVLNGAALTITSVGATWTNNLAVDGSITALTVTGGVATNPTNITSSLSGNQLTLSWPADHQGWFLQTQTNSRAVGLSSTWFDVTGSSATNLSVITITPGEPTVFFRLRNP